MRSAFVCRSDGVCSFFSEHLSGLKPTRGTINSFSVSQGKIIGKIAVRQGVKVPFPDPFLWELGERAKSSARITNGIKGKKKKKSRRKLPHGV